MQRRGQDDEIRACIDRPRPGPRVAGTAAGGPGAQRSAHAPLGVTPADGNPRTLRMAVDTAGQWAPGRTLRVRFLDGDPAIHEVVEAYARQWLDHANVGFDFGADPDAEIRVSFARGGSWSLVGRDALAAPPGEATVNLGITLETTDDVASGVVLHEFGHVLGCVHEHQNPAVEIPWDRPAVFRYYAGAPNHWSPEDVEHNLFATYRRGRTQFSRFDAASIMVYPIPEQHTIGDFAVGFNSTLSATDTDFIGIVYPFVERPVVGLTVDGPPAEAAIGAHAEEDRFELTVVEPGRFVLETMGRTDVVLALFGPDDGGRLVADDDDSGSDRNARIATQLAPGTYLVRVRHHAPTGTGRYRLSVRTEA